MECPWYKGTKGMPFSEMLCNHMKCPKMPFVQRYDGNSIFRNALRSHGIFYFINITSKYGKKSGSALRLWKTSNAEREPNKKARGGPPTTKTKQIISICYHQKVVDNTILPSYYHTSRSHVEINFFCVEILPCSVPPKDDIDFLRIFSWENK